MSRSASVAPTLLHRFSRDELPPHGGFVLWNPGGAGRLRTLCGPFSVTPPDPVLDLTRQELVVVLDDVPLIRRQATECPTCAQLLQVGCGSAEMARRYAEAINRISVGDVLGEATGWIETLRPILQLLPAGVVLLTLDDYYPTDGEGRFFWTAFNRLTDCDALRSHFHPAERPLFLAPTQPAGVFRPEAQAAAEQSYATRPGLALHLDGCVSALLDGHHRALCAARHGAHFPCITMRGLFWPEQQLGANRCPLPPSVRQYLDRDASPWYASVGATGDRSPRLSGDGGRRGQFAGRCPAG